MHRFIPAFARTLIAVSGMFLVSLTGCQQQSTEIAKPATTPQNFSADELARGDDRASWG